MTGKEAHNAHNGGRSSGGDTYGGGVGGGGTGMLGTGDCRMSTLLSDVSHNGGRSAGGGGTSKNDDFGSEELYKSMLETFANLMWFGKIWRFELTSNSHGFPSLSSWKS